MNLATLLNPSIDRETLKNPNLLSFWATVGIAIILLFTHFGLFPVPMFIAGIVGLVAVGIAWKWPRTLFGMLLATIPLEYVPIALAGGTNVRWYQLLALALVLGILIRWVGRKESIQKFFTSLCGWDALPVAILLASIVSAMQNGGGAMQQTIILGSFVGLYFLVRFFVRSRKDIFANLPFLIGSFYIVSLYAVIQNILFAFGKASGEVMPGRPNATFAEADWLGLYAGLGVVLGAVLVASILLLKTELTKKQQALRILSYEMFFFGSVVLILTVARSAWIATALGLLVIGFFLFFQSGFYKAFQWGKHLLLIAILSVCISFGFHLTDFELGNRVGSIGGLQEITVACEGGIDTVVPKTIDRAEDLVQYGCQHINLEEVHMFTEKGFVIQKIFRKDPNVEIRKNIWATSWDTLKQNPIWGIGWGNISQKLGVDERGATLNASNIFLEFWLGAGVVGFVGIVVLLGYIFIKNISEAQGARRRAQEEGSNVSSHPSVSKTQHLPSGRGGGQMLNVDTSFIFSVGVIGILTTLIIFNLFNSGQFLALFWVTLAFTLTPKRRSSH